MTEPASPRPAFLCTDQPISTGASKPFIYEESIEGPVAPPIGFWSLTLYDAKQFLVDNPLDRYAVTGESPLKRNDDGSFDIFIQATDPGGDKSSNWLPSPADRPFNLTLRIYIPNAPVLNGSWAPPPVRPV